MPERINSQTHHIRRARPKGKLGTADEGVTSCSNVIIERPQNVALLRIHVFALRHNRGPLIVNVTAL